MSQVLMLTSSTSFHTCPSIRMMYIPLNCAIVVELYIDSSILSRPAPHTQTQLYTSLALSLLSRYLNKTGHPLARYLPHSLEELRSETDIYQRMCTFCYYLCVRTSLKCVGQFNQKQVTVIIPYTGQMLNLLDVRVTTINSYQGEENGIILLSLVRSKVPGFENRICVAVSRASHVIGNFSISKLFEPLWRALVKCVKRFDSNLPVECQQHCAVTKVTRPEDFDSVSHGGCPLPCNSRLLCRHMCPFKCHPDPDNNSHECEQQCPNYCYQGHRCKKKCFECKIAVATQSSLSKVCMWWMSSRPFAQVVQRKMLATTLPARVQKNCPPCNVSQMVYTCMST